MSYSTPTFVNTGDRSPPTVASHLSTALSLKAAGNKHFSEDAFSAAIKSYKQALTYIKFPGQSISGFVAAMGGGSVVASGTPTPSESIAISQARVDIGANLALCYLKLDDFAKAEAAAREGLEIQPENVKLKLRLLQALLRPHEDCEQTQQPEPDGAAAAAAAASSPSSASPSAQQSSPVSRPSSQVLAEATALAAGLLAQSPSDAAVRAAVVLLKKLKAAELERVRLAKIEERKRFEGKL